MQLKNFPLEIFRDSFFRLSPWLFKTLGFKIEVWDLAVQTLGLQRILHCLSHSLTHTSKVLSFKPTKSLCKSNNRTVLKLCNISTCRRRWLSRPGAGSGVGRRQFSVYSEQRRHLAVGPVCTVYRCSGAL